MKKHLVPIVVAALALFSPTWTSAADDAPVTTDKPATDTPAAAKPAAPTSPAAPAAPGRGAANARGGGRFGQGGPGGQPTIAGTRDPLEQLIVELGEVNLTIDFTLTPEQKQKIQVIRDDFKKQADKWKADHAAELKKIQDDFAALRNNAGGGAQGGQNNNRQQFQEVIQARQTLMDTAPKPDEAIAQIKGLLSTEQLKQLQVVTDQLKAEADQQRQDMMARFGANGGRGGAAGGAAGGRRGGAAGGAAGGAGGGRGGRGGRGGGAGGAGGANGA